MKDRVILNAMKASISEVFEQMFFLPVDLLVEKTVNSAGDGAGICATIEFEGDPCGCFRLAIPRDLARSITADFMGEEAEDVTADQVDGTVKEIINMLAGNTLSAYDRDAVFSLHIPDLVAASRAEGDLSKHPKRFDVTVDTLDNRMYVTLAVD